NGPVMPALERITAPMHAAPDEAEAAFRQHVVGLRDGKEKLDRGVEALLPEAAELDGRDRGEVRGGDEVRNRDAQAHGGAIPADCTASFQVARSSLTACSNSAGVLHTASTPILSSRAENAVSRQPAAISRASRSTMAFGVAAGAT